MIQIGVMSMSAVLKEAGHECDILIENLERDFLESIVKYKPDAVGLSCTTGLHLWAIQTARRIKNRIDVPIIVGGPHATFYPDAICDDSIDVVCIGEGEYPILELARNLEDGNEITSIKNLWVRDNQGLIHKNPIRPLIQDLDSLPFIDRKLYQKYRSLRAYEHSPLVSTGRGCPYSCSFCFNKPFRDMYSETGGRYVRKRTCMNVINEISAMKVPYDVKRIIFMDDILTLDHEWLFRFLEAYRKYVALPFSCTVRADSINEPVVKTLKDSGCFFARMGLESGNEQLRNEVLNKKLSTDQIMKAAHLIKKYGIKLSTNSILGMPGETMDTALETLRMNIDIRPNFAWCSLMQPYPKTELADYAIAHGYLSHDFNFDDIDDSYFFSTPIEIPDKTAIANLQKFFSACVSYPFLLPVAKRLAKSAPPNAVFDLIFRMNYALGNLRTGEIGLEDFIRLGLHSGLPLRRAATFTGKSDQSNDTTLLAQPTISS